MTHVGSPMRPGTNRYRLSCAHYLDCGCIHAFGASVYCLPCGEKKRVTYSAISVRENGAELPEIEFHSEVQFR